MSTTLSTFNDLPFAGSKIEAKPTGSHMWGLRFGDIILADAMNKDEATYFAAIHNLRVRCGKTDREQQHETTMKTHNANTTRLDEPVAPCYAVLATLERLSREADNRRTNESWMRTTPLVQSGPLTPNLAKECGMTISKARYHLTRLWKAGLIERHKSYVGCMCRWYVKQTPHNQ